MSFRLLSSVVTLGLVSFFSGCSAGDTTNPSATGAGASGGTGSGSGGTAGTGADAGSGGTTAGTAGTGGTSEAGTGGTTGGSAGSGGGDTGGSGGGAAGPVMPTEAGGVYTWTYGDVVFAVDSMVAGRVVTYTKGGVSILDATMPHATNYGSTFWPSPQTWDWNIVGTIDTVAMTPTLEGATLVLQGAPIPTLDLSIGKRFTVDATCDCVEIVYSIKNESAAALKVAPWEITRVDGGGITFFPAPAAPHKLEPNANIATFVYDAVNQITWFDYAAEVTAAPEATRATDRKIYQDGTTWVAHAQAPAQGSLLLVKTFEDVPASAQVPDPPRTEGQIEIYTNGDDPDGVSYVEVENQGAYVELAAGESLTYPVKWYLRTIPSTVTVASGDMTLYTFAAGVASGIAPL